MNIEPAPIRGIRTSELWSKVAVQLVLVLNALFGLGINISDEVALILASVMETAYTVARAWSKRAPAGLVASEQLVLLVAALREASTTTASTSALSAKTATAAG